MNKRAKQNCKNNFLAFFPKGKKAASIIMMIFELIVVIFVIFMAFTVARNFGSSDTANKIYLANDLKMMMDTLVGTPGDAVVEYPGDVSRYSLILTSHYVTVLIKGESEAREVTRRFYLPEGYSAEGVLEEKMKLCLTKTGRRIILQECK